VPVRFIQNSGDIEVKITLTLEAGAKTEDTNIKRMELAIGEHVILMEFTSNGKIDKFFVNSRDLSSSIESFRLIQRSGLIPSLIEEIPSGKTERTYKSTLHHNRMGNYHFTVLLVEKVKKLVHANTSIERISSLVESFGIGSSQAMLDLMRNNPYSTDSWIRSISNWTATHEGFQAIRDLVIAKLFPELLDFIGSYVNRYANNITYIAPIRATAERYYRLQGLAVGEVDFQGQNMAMFLRNMSTRDRERFTKWMLTHFGFAPQTHFEGGHISIRIIESGGRDTYNLADMGFGFSQILPIVTQLWVLAHQRSLMQRRNPQVPITFAIEQPELHLHPQLQARFADALVSTISASKELRLDLRLLVETHSETIINKLGHHVAKKTINPEAIGVVLFEKPSPERSTTVSLGEYDSSGFLINWPFGFFDVV
jgi:hypothetical protein